MKAGSVAKLVAYCTPANRTGGAKAPPSAILSPSRMVIRDSGTSRLSVVSRRVMLGTLGQVAQLRARHQAGAGVECAELEQSGQALIDPVAGLVEQVVVEKGAGPGHRPRGFGRGGRGTEARERLGRDLQRECQPFGIELEGGASDGGQADSRARRER